MRAIKVDTPVAKPPKQPTPRSVPSTLPIRKVGRRSRNVHNVPATSNPVRSRGSQLDFLKHVSTTSLELATPRASPSKSVPNFEDFSRKRQAARDETSGVGSFLEKCCIGGRKPTEYIGSPDSSIRATSRAEMFSKKPTVRHSVAELVSPDQPTHAPTTATTTSATTLRAKASVIPSHLEESGVHRDEMATSAAVLRAEAELIPSHLAESAKHHPDMATSGIVLATDTPTRKPTRPAPPRTKGIDLGTEEFSVSSPERTPTRKPQKSAPSRTKFADETESFSETPDTKHTPQIEEEESLDETFSAPATELQEIHESPKHVGVRARDPGHTKYVNVTPPHEHESLAYPSAIKAGIFFTKSEEDPVSPGREEPLIVRHKIGGGDGGATSAAGLVDYHGGHENVRGADDPDGGGVSRGFETGDYGPSIPGETAKRVAEWGGSGGGGGGGTQDDSTTQGGGGGSRGRKGLGAGRGSDRGGHAGRDGGLDVRGGRRRGRGDARLRAYIAAQRAGLIGTEQRAIHITQPAAVHPAIIPVGPTSVVRRAPDDKRAPINIRISNKQVVNEKKRKTRKLTKAKKGYNALKRATIKAIKSGRVDHYKRENEKIKKLPVKKRKPARDKLKQQLKARERKLIDQLPRPVKMSLDHLSRLMILAKKLRW